MNKVILGLILAVCLLGMALVMLNERLGRQAEIPVQNKPVAETRIPADLDFPETPVNVNPAPPPSSAPFISPLPDSENAQIAERTENAEAEAALAPPAPQIEEKPVVETTPPRASLPAPKVTPAPSRVEKPEIEKPIIAAKPAVADKGKEKTINRFVIFAREKGATIRIGGGSRIHYNSMTLDNPDRIVVDMDGQWQFPPSPGVPKNEMVSNVRIGKNGEKTRVVIDLKEKARMVRIIPSKNGDSMDIRVDK